MTDGVRKMEKYEQLAIVGEGSYGLVMKCRHRETEQIVAIKKFLETEEDATVRRMALREIRMLKKLRHENLVTMIEVFRYRKRFYLVFEYLEGTVLDELEKMPGGLGDERSRERIYQVTRAINFCHSNHIIHRDVKPENVLVSSLGVVKLCDFGFARLVSLNGEPCTEYVATRWYRAPELLVGEQQYGPPVDVWAIGCLFAEMMTGDPLFPGDSDVDQLYLIVRMIGMYLRYMVNHARATSKSCLRAANYGAWRVQPRPNRTAYTEFFSNWSLLSLDFLVSCMKMDPQCRPSAEDLLKHNYFTHDRFPQKFLPALREKVLLQFNANPLLRKYKADILLSSDRREEIRQRRSLQADPPKWKISLTESSSIKRKFSCDTVSSGCEMSGSDKSPLNAIKATTTSTTGNVGALRSSGFGQKSGTANFIKQQQQVSSDKRSTSKTGALSQTNLDLGRESELQKLERSLENLAKLPNHKADSSGSSPLLQFQSLQPHQQQQQQYTLHPSINNIGFTREAPKKSPNLLHDIQNASLKGAFSQVPLVNPPRTQYLKKLDRNPILDSMFANVEPIAPGANQNRLLLTPSWLNGNNVNSSKGKGRKADEFSLPSVPGVSAISPNKVIKKKIHPSPDARHNAVTPRIQSTTSQKSSSSKPIISSNFGTFHYK